MQLYVLDRAKNTLATTASFYNDKHHKELTAGASTFEFTVDKTDDAAQYMSSGNYIVYQDDRGRAWSFTILDYDETQTARTVFAEDVSIELLNKAMDVWSTTEAHPFSYYFDLVTKGTPWKLGVNQLTDLSRKLVYTGRDTGLGRLLSVLKGFDIAECQFNIKVKQNSPVEFTVDVYKSIGTVQDNIQIVYNNELNGIKKTESRAQFVTALAGIGGLVENQATTDPGLEKHIDFADIAYKDDNFISPKGDKFLRAVTANKTFNPGTTTYIEDFYDYDTQSAQELLNRTLTQLKERSEPQYTYDADVKVIDPTLDIGDTVTIIDHDYNPALYLQARVATLDKSYTDPTQGTITFCNYRVLNSNLSNQLRAMQNIIDQLPTSASIKVINNNIVQMITDNVELKKQVTLALKSADGKSTIYFDAKPSTAQEGDVAFVKNADGVTEIWKFVEGSWKPDTSIATFDDVKKVASQAAAAGSQATVAGQQASAAGSQAIAAGLQASTAGSQAVSAGSQASVAGSQAAVAGKQASAAGSQAVVAGSQASAAGVIAKSAGDYAKQQAAQAAIDTQAAQTTANSAVDFASMANVKAGFANDTADQAKSAAADAQSGAAQAKSAASTATDDASAAVAQATKSFDDAQTALQNAINAQSTALKTQTIVDDLSGTVTQLSSQTTVLDGKVTTVQNLAQASIDGLKLKADTTTVNLLTQTVDKQSSQLDLTATKAELQLAQTSVDDLKKTVNDQALSIAATASGLDLKANTTTVNQLTGDVSDLKEEFNVQAGLVSAKVTATDVTGMLNGYATETWSQDQLTLAKNEISASVETVQTQIQNSAVGTNLLTGTSSSEQSYTGDFSTVPSWGDASVSQVAVNAGSTYTYSIYLTKLTGSFVGGYWGYDSNKKYAGWFPSGANSSLGKFSWTFTIPSGISYIVPHVAHLSDDFACTAKEEKLEKGSVATDWCLAPEDQATVDWTKAQLDIKDGEISAAVTSLKSDITNATADMATQTWTRGELELTASGFKTQISSVEDGLTKQYTQLQQTLDGVQVTANNAVTQGQLTLLSDQFTSTISGISIGGTNLLTRTSSDLQPAPDSPNSNTGGTLHTFGSDELNILAGNQVTVSAFIHNTTTHTVNLVMWTNGGGFGVGTDVPAGTDGYSTITAYNITSSATSGDITVRAYTENATISGVQYKELKLEKGNKATDWSPAPKDVQSQFTQLQNDINLRVKTGVLIQQINLSTEGILIDGSKTHITNTTTIDNGVIKNASIADAAITTAKIGALAVTAANIANAAITNAKIAALAVGTAQIADAAINSAKIGALAVNTAQIANTAITSAKIALLAVGTAQIADAAINSAKIAALAVGTAQIANAAITNAKIGALAVGTAQIADGAISTAKIGKAAITSAQIADASILNAKIVSLDGSKIVANSITADKLDVNAIAVGLNAYGSGWQITPASIAWMPTGTTHASISLTGDMGITFGDLVTGETLGHMYGTPYNMNAGKDWFNGISTVMKYNGADYWAVLSEESDGTVRPRLMYSRNRIAELGVWQGLLADSELHVTGAATIGSGSTGLHTDSLYTTGEGTGLWLKRGTVGGRAVFNIMNASQQSGIAFTDDGALYLGRAGKWYNLYDIVNKIGIA